MLDPTTVNPMLTGSRRRSMTPFRANGNEPPALMKMRAIMFVATATCGSIPIAIISGTVIRDVLPVTTLTTLVRKKIEMRTKDLPSAMNYRRPLKCSL